MVVEAVGSFSFLYQTLQIPIDNLIVVAGLTAALIPQMREALAKPILSIPIVLLYAMTSCFNCSKSIPNRLLR